MENLISAILDGFCNLITHHEIATACLLFILFWFHRSSKHAKSKSQKSNNDLIGVQHIEVYSRKIVGEIKNKSDKTFRTVEITATLKDKDKKAVYEKSLTVIAPEKGKGLFKPNYTEQFVIELDHTPSDWKIDKDHVTIDISHCPEASPALDAGLLMPKVIEKKAEPATENSTKEKSEVAS